MKLAELVGIARPLEVTRHGLVQRLAVPPGPLGRKLSNDRLARNYLASVSLAAALVC
jgi:hypothetical protein